MQKIKEKIYGALRWSEQYTATDMVYLAKGGFWLFFGQIVASASSFFLAIAFANLMPKEVFGSYKYALSMAAILAAFTLQGMNTSVIQAVSRGFEGSFLTGLKTRIRWGLLGGFGGIILAGYYYWQDNSALAASFLIVAVFIPFMDSFGIYESLLLGRKLFSRSASFGVISRIGVSSALIILLFLNPNLFLILFAYFAFWTIARFILLRLALKNFPPNNKEDQQAIAYGKHLSFMKGVGSASGSINNILLFHFLGGTNLAVFSFAVAPIEQMRGFLGIAENLILPKMSREEWRILAFRDFARKLAPFLFILTLVIALYIVVAPYFFNLAFPFYRESIIFSQIYALSLMLSAINTVQLSILRAKQRTKELHIMTFLDVFLTFALALPAIYYFGIAGLIGAIIFSKIIETAAMSVLIFQKPFNSEKKTQD